MFDSVGIQQTKLVSLNICRGCGLIYKYFLIECIVIFVLLIKNVNITHQQLFIFVNNKYVRLIVAEDWNGMHVLTLSFQNCTAIT